MMKYITCKSGRDKNS